VLTRCGDDLFSIAVDTPADAQALAQHIRRDDQWLEIIPGIASVVVRFDIATLDGAVARTKLAALVAAGVEPLPEIATIVEIPVVYGGECGPDLDELSATTNLPVEEIIALHTSRDYPVDMVGFTPGFAFIGGLDERLRVPRRAKPRQRVPSGSIGIADGRTGIYAMASPGGWTLIGRTSYPLFDPGADDPFVLAPGMRVRFRAVVSDDR
jgi:allophanate hydrolase